MLDPKETKTPIEENKDEPKLESVKEDASETPRPHFVLEIQDSYLSIGDDNG